MKTTNELKTRACRTFGLSRYLIVQDPELRRTLDEDSILFDSYDKLSRYDKGLVRRWIELQLKKDEWQLLRNKVLVFVGLTLTTLLVLTVIFGSLSGKMQIPLVMTCSAIVAAMLRHFRHFIDGP